MKTANFDDDVTEVSFTVEEDGEETASTDLDDETLDDMISVLEDRKSE